LFRGTEIKLKTCRNIPERRFGIDWSGKPTNK
jgi:hypothetical protein